MLKIQNHYEHKFPEPWLIYIYRNGFLKLNCLLKEKKYYLFKQDLTFENYLIDLSKKTLKFTTGI